MASYGTAPLITNDTSSAMARFMGGGDDDGSSFATADLATAGMGEGPPASDFQSAAPLVRGKHAS